MYIYLYSSSNQFGYKKKSGTELCLYSFKQIVEFYNNANSNVYCCFLDASRAYDRVSHKKLFNMLSTRNVPLIFIRILAFWYKHQTLIVKWGNSFSLPFYVSNGVRQGSVLSPYLFCVYVDAISIRLNDLKIGCKLKDMIINHLFYADDLCLFCPSSRGLQVLLNVCFICAQELDIVFNKSKCKIMIFKCASFRNVSVPSFFIDEQVLEECTTYRYLGHIISNNCSDHNDITRQCRSTYAKGNTLIRKFYKCSDKVKVILFKAYCTSLYTSELWCRYSESSLRKMRVAYHGIFKKFLNYPRSTSNSLLFVFYNVPSFQELIRKNISSFRTRLANCENDIVSQVLSSRCLPSSCLSRRWLSLLH